MFYLKLYDMAMELNNALKKDNPDYKKVIETTNHMLNLTQSLSSIESGNHYDLITLDDFRFSGRTLPSNFISGVFGLVFAPVAFVVGILAMPLYVASRTGYLGSPTFLLDAAKYFLDSISSVLSPVLLPAAILKSKASTGSYNVFKGDLLRSIVSVAKIANSKIPAKKPPQDENGRVKIYVEEESNPMFSPCGNH